MKVQRESRGILAGYRRRPVLWTARIALAAGLVLALLVGVARAATQQAPPVNTSPPTVSGTAQDGQIVTANPGVWGGSQPISFAFQWQSCDAQGANCVDIAGRTGQQYDAVAADVGRRLRVVVVATNSAGSTAAASAATGVVVQPGSPPTPVRQPDPSGTAQVGQTVTVNEGQWLGSDPVNFTYQWQRCPVSGPTCVSIPGATNAAYTVSAADVGFRLRAIVTGTNVVGSVGAPSNLTAVVTQPGAPINTGRPTIENATRLTEGDTATGQAGAWVGNQPIAFTFAWSRCNARGAECRTIPGETRPSYLIRQADIGFSLVLTVRAANAVGATLATTAPTATIRASGLPAGAVRLPSGRISVPASSVSLPHRMVIADVKFEPVRLNSRNPFQGRFLVTDTRGYVVRDALVFVIGLPYNYVRGLQETRTAQDGWVSLTIFPTGNLPLRKGGAIVFFVRARKEGASLLAGVSTRRLVQVRVDPTR